jgi:hypothetical protein
MRKYTADLKAYDEKVEAGQKQVEELSARFGEWYYVIPAESFNKLHLKRSDLVKSKTKPAADAPEGAKAKDPFPDDGKEPADKDDAKEDEAEKDAGKKDKKNKEEAGEDAAKEGASAKAAAGKDDAAKAAARKTDTGKKSKK